MRRALWRHKRFRSLRGLSTALSRDFVACTVASRRFLAQAAVLAESFFEHHPQGRFAVLIPDDPGGEREMDPRIESVRTSRSWRLTAPAPRAERRQS